MRKMVTLHPTWQTVINANSGQKKKKKNPSPLYILVPNSQKILLPSKKSFFSAKSRPIQGCGSQKTELTVKKKKQNFLSKFAS